MEHVLKNGRKVWVETFSGEVINSSKEVYTTVHGNSGIVSNGNTITQGYISTDVHKKNVVRLCDANGNLRQIDFAKFSDMNLVDGDLVTVIRGAPKGIDEGDYFGALNHTSNRIICHHTHNPNNKLVFHSGILTFLATISILAFLGYLIGAYTEEYIYSSGDWAWIGFGWGVAIGLITAFTRDSILTKKAIKDYENFGKMVLHSVNIDDLKEAKNKRQQGKPSNHSSSTDIVDRIAELGKFKEQGLLSNEEFAIAKSKLLA